MRPDFICIQIKNRKTLLNFIFNVMAFITLKENYSYNNVVVCCQVLCTSNLKKKYQNINQAGIKYKFTSIVYT